MVEMTDTWEYEGKEFMKCPKCGKGILASMKWHRCGWRAEAGMPEVAGEVKVHVPMSSEPASKSSQLPSETRQLMHEAVSEVCSVFDMSLADLKHDIDKYSTIVNTIFISKRGGR
jgi:hypothetical protein